MGSDRWLRTKAVLAAALEQAPDRRSAFLDEACGGDADLRSEVESLLDAHDQSGAFIEEPAPFALDLDADAVIPPDLPDQDALVGQTLGAYHVEACIGRGGMGAVYRARRNDQEFDRRVAIKMIRRGMDSSLVIRRFRHERQILASLDHPNIAALFDGGTTPDGLPYFVMEFVAGTPIDRYADDHALSIPQRVKLFLGVLDAVQHAHDHHIVHRDIKPTNVLVTMEGRPKLLDFGIAKILEPGAESGSTFTSLRPMTPEYASPEQVRGESVTPSTDVYSLGMLLYELLTHRRPYQVDSTRPDELTRAICEQDPAPPSTTVAGADRNPETRQQLAGPLDDIILKALRKEPEQRYTSIAALAADLRLYIDGQPVSTAWDSHRYRARRVLQRHRAAIGVAAIVSAAVLATAVSVTVWSARHVARSTPSVAAAPPARASLAVVGFRNLSRRPSDDWISTAATEMLTTELAGDGQLRVVPADQIARIERDLGVGPGTDFDVTGIDRLRKSLASDYVVLGTFAVSDSGTSRSLRIDVRLHRDGAEPIAVAGSGDESRIFSVISEVGGALRGQLRLNPSTPEATSGSRAAFPQGLEATRLYAEGTARLRLLDAVAARDLLERAAALEPGSALIQTALASAWTALGYDARAVAAAQKAFDASSGLNREDRLIVEGRLDEALRKWPSAIDVYRTLWGFFSDNVEYGLRLTAAQTSAGRGNDALATIAEMRQVPAPQSEDPRIDLAEVQAFGAIGDYSRESAAIQQAIERANRSGSRLLIARAHLFEGRNRGNHAQLKEAVKSFEAAHQLFLDGGDKAGAAVALNSLASVLSDLQDISRAEQMYQQALATSEEIGDRRDMAAVLNNYGILLKDQRRFDEARRMHERALAIRRDVGDATTTAVSLSNIGVVLFEQDRFAEASTYYKESLAIARDVGDKRGQIRALHNLAIVDREMGHLAAARKSDEQSLAMRAEIGDKRGTVAARVELGIVMLAQGEVANARKTAEEALALAREIGLKGGESQALYQLGEVARVAGDLPGARKLHEQALAIRDEMKETRTILESRVALAELALEEQRPEEAERQAKTIADAVGHDESSGPVPISLGILMARARLALHDVDGAGRTLAPAAKLADRTENVDVRRQLVMVQAEIDAARGAIDRARERLTELRASQARSGMVLAELESRALILRLDRSTGSKANAEAAALERAARAHGAGLIVRRIHNVESD
jgi:serine/threonine protein kinase/tetratricopeptide (TPR) repeat protein/TolB-like protein